jgi:hypothetical protein
VRFGVIFDLLKEESVNEDQSGHIGPDALRVRQPGFCAKLGRRPEKQIERGRRPGETNFPGCAGEQNRISPRFATNDFGFSVSESGFRRSEGDFCASEGDLAASEANLFQWTMRRKVKHRWRRKEPLA